MKKTISLLCALAMTASLIPCVYAENADNMKSVLVSVKERLEIPEEYSEFSSGTYEQYGYEEYDFEWRTEDGGKYINVNCYDDGTITSYYNYSGYSRSSSPAIPTISKETAKSNAEAFAKKLNPDFPYELRIEDRGNISLYGGGYEFRAQIYVDGVPFDNGNCSVTVDGETGEVGNFYMNYYPIEFPSVENAVSVDAAIQAYSDNLGLELIYRIYTDDNENETAYPVYVQKYSYNKYINALTGEVFDFAEGSAGGARNAMYSTAQTEDAAADKGLTEQEIKEIENINGLISKEDIEKQLKSNKILNIPKTMTVNSIRLNKRGNKDEYTYSISMSDSDENSLYTSVDAKTGEVQSYYRYGSETGDKETTNQNDKAFNALAGDKASEYVYNEDSGRYDRYVNGARVQSDDAYISYSGDTLTSYSIDYTDTEFPAIDGAISKADAEKIMFDKEGYPLVYMLKTTDTTMEAVPVYKHTSVSINALTGKYVNYRNEEVTDTDASLEYSDISGHYAEKIIKELAYYGVGFEGGEFKPDEKITQKDYLSLLNAVYSGGIAVTFGDDEQADYVYRSSQNKGIITADERDESANVTRETAAIYMIRAMDAEEYAKYDDIYVSPFVDVTKNKGYIALLAAMGVVHGGTDGTFSPDREITRAESAVMIYNYLTR